MNAGTTIGNVEITSILNIERGSNSPWSEINLVDKDENLMYKEAREAESISIEVALVEQLHSQGKNVEKQRQDLKSLIDNSPSDNSIDYKDVSGDLVIESVDIPESSDLSTYREGSISGFLISN
jgi:hypothetical protein